jgi:hypothetical protein
VQRLLISAILVLMAFDGECRALDAANPAATKSPPHRSPFLAQGRLYRGRGQGDRRRPQHYPGPGVLLDLPLVGLKKDVIP